MASPPLHQIELQQGGFQDLGQLNSRGSYEDDRRRILSEAAEMDRQDFFDSDSEIDTGPVDFRLKIHFDRPIGLRSVPTYTYSEVGKVLDLNQDEMRCIGAAIDRAYAANKDLLEPNFKHSWSTAQRKDWARKLSAILQDTLPSDIKAKLKHRNPREVGFLICKTAKYKKNRMKRDSLIAPNTSNEHATDSSFETLDREHIDAQPPAEIPIASQQSQCKTPSPERARPMEGVIRNPLRVIRPRTVYAQSPKPHPSSSIPLQVEQRATTVLATTDTQLAVNTRGFAPNLTLGTQGWIFIIIMAIGLVVGTALFWVLLKIAEQIEGNHMYKTVYKYNGN
ncbi:hypothetical protein H072_2423 [Dactylellina haptotyla CBS 200.50]|uniref:Uncharacterized protein n=1 Tax=Dactylellina haptotyla (strain CBS 200.50) TaxID=1284197 RepID=S8ARB6_DACHA|nr:hypothetical protein H072_2423 [Dactylellina haptotyla CBS 200.50]